MEVWQMKKVHIFTCFSLWTLWVGGIILLLFNLCLQLIIGNDANEFFFAVVEPYSVAVLLLSLIPIKPIMFIITLIIETLEWTKKSFLTVVVPFLVTVLMCFVYMCAFVGLTGGV